MLKEFIKLTEKKERLASALQKKKKNPSLFPHQKRKSGIRLDGKVISSIYIDPDLHHAFKTLNSSRHIYMGIRVEQLIKMDVEGKIPFYDPEDGKLVYHEKND